MILQHSEHPHAVEVDDTTGLPIAISLRGTNLSSGTGTPRVELSGFALSLTVGGTEQRSPTGGLDYKDTQHLEGAIRTGDATWDSTREGDRCQIPISLAGIALQITVLFRRHGPGISIGIVVNGDASSDLLIRNLKVKTAFQFPSGGWTLNAPGNGLARDVAFGTLTGWAGISPIGGLRGSSAVAHLGHRNRLGQPDHAVGLWFRHELEISEMLIKSDTENALLLDLATNFAGDLGRIARAAIDVFDIDLRVPEFGAFPAQFQTWMRLSGQTSPANPPVWIGSASIFEAQLGFSVFFPDHRYEPYPDVSALTADLERIAALGFKVVQLMPRQPYPSYNVHDYRDVATSFGDVDQIKHLVAECHRHGLRIILDVLLHGVLDQESIAAAADGVRGGPYANLISSKTSDSFSSDVGEVNSYAVAWSRHIIDFEPFWKAGSPSVSPLIAQHPDWFYTDSSGKVAGIYTKAFDARNPEWQRYFMDAMKYLMTELNIDGFRFDAPTYNDFPNWSHWARHRASMSTLGCIPLFERLRPELQAIKPDMLMYTEPSGLLLRRSMDLNYNYDEQWLVTAISDPTTAKSWGVNNARGLARWIEDRDAFLPRGSLTAHHIDSHDTFWWPSWGTKWRREQFPLLQVQLLTLIFMSLPGPYMMFIGGEQGIEDILSAVNTLKNTCANWAELEVTWLNGDEIPENVFGMMRHDASAKNILTLVNMGDHVETIVVQGFKARASKTPKIRLSVGTASSLTNLEALTIKVPARSGLVLEF